MVQSQKLAHISFILFINSRSPSSVHIQEERNWTPPLKGKHFKEFVDVLNYQTEFLVETPRDFWFRGHEG